MHRRQPREETGGLRVTQPYYYNKVVLDKTTVPGRRVDDEEMLGLLERWGGSRQRVCRLVWISGFTAPRRGPRLTIQDHRSH